MTLAPALLQFKFDAFANLPSGTGETVIAEPIGDSHGNLWTVLVEPGGNTNSEGDREDPYVGIYVQNNSECKVCGWYSIILRDALGKVYLEKSFKKFDSEPFEPGDDCGYNDFIPRSSLLEAGNNILADGALLIDIEIQYKPKEESHYMPPSSLAKNMLQLFEEGSCSDVSFKVGDEIIPSHRAILKMNSPVLFNSCEENNDGSPVIIDGLTAEMLRFVLRYIYGEQIPDRESIHDNGRDIIDAANRFGVVGLKLVVERILVESLVIDVYEAADWLIFADAKTCPLLKEYAMSVCVVRARDVLMVDNSNRLKESPNLMEELVNEVSKKLNNDNRYDDRSNTSVDDLRKQLHAEGMDIDGSKEMLVSRLQRLNKRKWTE